MSISKRRGRLTLVEVLVVIAIIGILIALLLPAIEAARQSYHQPEQAEQTHKEVLYIDVPGGGPVYRVEIEGKPFYFTPQGSLTKIH